MATITGLEIQKKDKTRCNIYIDGTFYCGLKLEVAIKHRLKKGMQVEEAFLDEIQLETEKQVALEKALAHLSATLKTVHQMKTFLSAKGYTSAVIDYAVEKLLSYGYLDDLAYCRAYINTVKGKGKLLIEQELRKRGADYSAIETALSEMSDSSEQSRAVAEKYMRSKEWTQQNLNKCFKYLLSKGFDYEEARAAISSLKDGD